MKRIFENWKKFLTEDVGENEATYPFRIFCDMDGVLVDLIGGLEKELRRKKFMIQAKGGKERTKQETALMSILGAAKSWDQLKQDPSTTSGQRQVLEAIEEILGENEQFWSNLEPMPDGLKLWSFISKYDPFILSHPWDKESKIGKEVWCSTSLNPAPSRVLFPKDGNKEQYARNKQNGTENILIDDMEDYLNRWSEAGGTAIRHRSADATISQLEQVMKELKGNKIEAS